MRRSTTSSTSATKVTKTVWPPVKWLTTMGASRGLSSPCSEITQRARLHCSIWCSGSNRLEGDNMAILDEKERLNIGGGDYDRLSLHDTRHCFIL